MSSPAPHFESINSLELSLLYGPTVTSIMTTGKIIVLNMWQSDVSAFYYAVQVCHSFSSREQASFNFMAAVTISSDFGTQENKGCHCFHCFPIYLPGSNGPDAMILVL